MIFHPKIGQNIQINYKDKSMANQGLRGYVVAVAKGPGPRNVLVRLPYALRLDRYDVVPRGNINASE